MIEDILPFALNTKQPLSNIWLLNYKQNNFGCFWKKLKVRFLSKTLLQIPEGSLQELNNGIWHVSARQNATTLKLVFKSGWNVFDILYIEFKKIL